MGIAGVSTRDEGGGRATQEERRWRSLGLPTIVKGSVDHGKWPTLGSRDSHSQPKMAAFVLYGKGLVEEYHLRQVRAGPSPQQELATRNDARS